MTKATRVSASIVLTDTQRQLCLAALQRPDGAIIMPARLKGRPAVSVAEALIGKSLVREIRAKADLPVWRLEAETGHRFSLVLTKAARTLLAAEGAATTLPVGAPAMLAAPAAPATLMRAEADDGKADVVIPGSHLQRAGTEPVSPRANSKLSSVITLLGRDAGSSVADIMAVTGWAAAHHPGCSHGLAQAGLSGAAGAGGGRRGFGLPHRTRRAGRGY